jgi:hypothetical protein
LTAQCIKIESFNNAHLEAELGEYGIPLTAYMQVNIGGRMHANA